jgi:hypothetical protein
MSIWVRYSNDHYDKVSAETLDRLIGQGKIIKFYRSEGWVTVGCDPLRGMGGSGYKGPDRRYRPENLPV